MKLTSILKEIKVVPDIHSFQGLITRINFDPAFKPQLIDAIYEDSNLTVDTGWPGIKQEIIETPIEVDEAKEHILLTASDDGILVSLKPFSPEDAEYFMTGMRSFRFQGAQFYYGLV
jgi:hypothetical protein